MGDKKLTKEDIEKIIVTEEYKIIGKKTVICCLSLGNGFEVIGSASCVNPANFDMEIGKNYSKEDAVNKIWQLEGYRMQCSNPV